MTRALSAPGCTDTNPADALLCLVRLLAREAARAEFAARCADAQGEV